MLAQKEMGFVEVTLLQVRTLRDGIDAPLVRLSADRSRKNAPGFIKPAVRGQQDRALRMKQTMLNCSQFIRAYLTAP